MHRSNHFPGTDPPTYQHRANARVRAHAPHSSSSMALDSILVRSGQAQYSIMMDHTIAGRNPRYNNIMYVMYSPVPVLLHRTPRLSAPAPVSRRFQNGARRRKGGRTQHLSLFLISLSARPPFPNPLYLENGGGSGGPLPPRPLRGLPCSMAAGAALGMPTMAERSIVTAPTKPHEA